MEIAKTANFINLYSQLPKSVQKQVDKQIAFLQMDFRYPSLRTKKFSGFKDWWEFRISKGYRMLGKKVSDLIVLHVVGPHDVLRKVS